MREKTLQIDDLDIRLVKFSPSIGMPILTRLQNMLGGSIVKLASGMGQSENGQIDVMASAIDDITNRVKPEVLQQFISDVITSGFVFINGEKITHIDDLGMYEDSDPYYLAVMILKEQLTFSFGGFLGKLMGNLTSSKAKPKRSSQRKK